MGRRRGTMPSSSGADAASGLDAALGLLSGPNLVAYLRGTCRRADYDAAARVLADRDRRLAHAEAALAKDLPDMSAKVEALRERYVALKAQQSRSSGGAIAAAAPQVDRRAEEPAPKCVIDLSSSSSSSDDDDWLEEGEFRGRRRLVGGAGVSCKRKESAAASNGEERRRAGVSCKRKAPASACSPDDEDDRIPLTWLIRKRRRSRAKPAEANGEPKKGHGDAQANSAGHLGVDRPVASPVNRGIPEAVAEHMLGSGSSDDPKVAVLVQGNGNGQSGKNAGLSRTMPSPPPTGSTAGNSPHKKCSKPDGSEGRARIGEKQGPVAGPENGAPVQVRTPVATDTARRILGSARVGPETPMEHTDSSSDGQARRIVVPKSIKGQEKAIGGVHKLKVSLETNGTGDKASTVLKDTREHGKPALCSLEHISQNQHHQHQPLLMPAEQAADGQVLHTKVLSRSDGIKEQGGKLSPCQSLVDATGGRPTTPDKPVSATLQRKSQFALHSEQMSVQSSLPSAVTGRWKSSSDVFISCLENKELCMQAVCALHRQKKFTSQPTVGRITKFDAHRVAVLAEFLLDGNLQGPLKRTAEDLEKHDSTGHDFLERVVLQFSEQLFSIYRNKDDKYFR